MESVYDRKLQFHSFGCVVEESEKVITLRKKAKLKLERQKFRRIIGRLSEQSYYANVFAIVKETRVSKLQKDFSTLHRVFCVSAYQAIKKIGPQRKERHANGEVCNNSSAALNPAHQCLIAHGQQHIQPELRSLYRGKEKRQ